MALGWADLFLSAINLHSWVGIARGLGRDNWDWDFLFYQRTPPWWVGIVQIVQFLSYTITYRVLSTGCLDTLFIFRFLSIFFAPQSYYLSQSGTVMNNFRATRARARGPRDPGGSHAQFPFSSFISRHIHIYYFFSDIALMGPPMVGIPNLQ